jgi:hypothetical protein
MTATSLDTAASPATLDRIRRHLVGLNMPRALEVIEHILRRIERGEISALGAAGGTARPVRPEDGPADQHQDPERV